MFKMSSTAGCDCDSTILAAMDMAATPWTSPGCNREGVCVQVQALGKIHAQKVRTLMRSISELKKKLELAIAQGKDHRRSAMIRAMKRSLRQQELVIDVIKDELGRKAGMGKEETNDWVIRKTVGGPLRFRPKTREELQNDLYQLEKKHRQTLDKLKARRPSHDTVKKISLETEGRQGGQEAPQSEKATIAGTGGVGFWGDERKQSTEQLMRLSDALEEADALRVAVRSRDAALRAQAEALDKLQAENREFRELQERLGRKERRARELRRKNAELGEQHTSLLEDYDACQEQIQHLKAQLELRKEEAAGESEGFRQQSLRQAEEVSLLLGREEDLVAALEEEVAARGRERRENHHSARQVTQRAESAERAEQETKRQERRLREQNMAMVAELQRIGKDAVKVAELRERGRELAREVKRLTQEGEARQKRLEEARERSATAEEAFRASQESLEQERTSKDLLLREAGEAQESLLEERALREAERDRLAEEVDARKQLETLLASEREKEQVVHATRNRDTEDEKRSWSNKDTNTEVKDKERAGEAQTLMPEDDPVKSSDKRRAPHQPRDLMEEMTSELRRQEERIDRLEIEKQAVNLQYASATKVAEDLRAQEMAGTREQLDATQQQAHGDSGEEDCLSDGGLPARRIYSYSVASPNENKARRLDPEDAKVNFEVCKVAVEKPVAENLDSVGGDGEGALMTPTG